MSKLISVIGLRETLEFVQINHYRQKWVQWNIENKEIPIKS